MIVQLRKDENNVIIGYEIIQEHPEEHALIEQIRDMYFWIGVKYDGREPHPNSDDTHKLKFIRKDKI